MKSLHCVFYGHCAGNGLKLIKYITFNAIGIEPKSIYIGLSRRIISTGCQFQIILNYKTILKIVGQIEKNKRYSCRYKEVNRICLRCLNSKKFKDELFS